MNHPRSRLALSTIALVAAVLLVPAITGSGAPPAGPQYDEYVFLPFVAKPICPATSGNSYSHGPATRHDPDDPVRPAAKHADKNLALRSYTSNTDTNLQRELVNYDGASDEGAPQLATLFADPRVPGLVGFYRVYDWIWADSPEPGTRGDPLPVSSSLPYRVTALGVRTTPGEPLHVPLSGSALGGEEGAAAIVIFADEDTVALHYTREDSAALGYTIHVDRICTDPNLLRLYKSLDVPGGPRYSQQSYPLPTLTPGQSFGRARFAETVVAVVDTGRFMDPRSCKDWWQFRPDYQGSCPMGYLSAGALQ